MKLNQSMFVFMAVLSMLASSVFADDKSQKEILKDNNTITSYSLGVQTAKTLLKDDPEINIDMFVRGLKDVASGAKLPLSDDDFRKVLNNFQVEMRRKLKNKHAVEAADNIKQGKQFFDENRVKEGVVTTQTGLQYKIITEGTGPKPTETDTVLCNYSGRTLDGKVFDHNQEGVPASLQVSKMIPGFKEALKLMPVGSKWQVFIPSPLAYGPRSVGADIGPNETLVFDLELLEIK